MLKVAFWTVVVVATLITGFGFAAARKSTGMSPPTIGNDGALPRCSKTPNCVTTEVASGHAAYIEPIKANITTEQLSRHLQTLGGRITSETDILVQAEFRTRLFKFTDDMMVKIDKNDGILRIRSSSRVGKSDLGANRKRVEALRQLINSRSD